MTELTPELLTTIEAISIWKPASVTQEPETQLTSWRVFEVTNESGRATHFIGYAGYEGRVSSPVQTYDPETKRGITRSDRVYELVGASGNNSDALYVWGRWLSLNHNPEHNDVTEKYESV